MPIFKNGNTYTVAPAGSLDIHSQLPPGNYVLKLNPQTGFYLESVLSFTLPSKVYGTATSKANRILRTFSERPNTTGVLLVGEKGSGKTLLARSVSMIGATYGYPTIIINTPFNGDEFNSFLQSLEQPCIVLFDEFEKVYDKEKQERILTLLDGVFPTKKLFILTSNDKYRIDTNMKNRPGRIYYLLEFAGLDEEFIQEYCADNLNPQHDKFVSDLVSISSRFDVFNFDMLVAFVEEINRYGDSPQELMGLLNAKPEYCGGTSYKVRQVFFGAKQIPPCALDESDLFDTCNLVDKVWEIDVYISYPKDKYPELRNIERDGWEVDNLVEILNREDVRFATREDKAGHFSRIGQEKSRSLIVIRMYFEEADISLYTANGARYENEKRCTIDVVRHERSKRPRLSM